MPISKSRWITTLFICGLGIFLALPNFLSSEFLEKMPGWFAKDKVSLGLDLQGGSSLLLEVDIETALKDFLENTINDVRSILRKKNIWYRTPHITPEGTIEFFLRNSLDKEDVYSLLRKSITQDKFQIQTEDNNIKLILMEEAKKMRQRAAVEQSIEIVRKRIDEMGTKEPSIQRQGESRILVQLPGIEDPSIVKEMLGKTAKLSFKLTHSTASAEDALHGKVPFDGELAFEDRSINGVSQRIPIVLEKRTILTGDMLVGADAGLHPEKGTPVVNFEFDAIGSKKFSDTTLKNVHRQFAIILDNKVISAPVINQHIPGGRGYIEGHFTYPEAQMLAALLRAGSLPAPLTTLEERTVGPDLGADSIAAGKKATLIAIFSILMFMLIVYGLVYGTIANIALIFNLVFLLGALSFLQATLTLPGIAGIALTLGMAVDANVLVFERIKEELRNKKRVPQAIKSGYERAMSTIIDSNVTTIIGGILLYQFGTGPVRGFAVTLILGILISMFTAISLTRLLVMVWFKIGGGHTLRFGIQERTQ